MITNIQRFCTHDGPGIRTTVFLKGCNLHCKWCHNPETLSAKVDIEFYKERCLSCGNCTQFCPQNALSMTETGLKFERNQCIACGKCAQICAPMALMKTGQQATVEDVMTEVCRDSAFYSDKGGLTISGGEPLLQPDFVCALLDAAKKEYINTAVDTAGNIPLEVIHRIAERNDLFLFDLKAITPELHKEATGVTNEQILSNLLYLSKNGKRIHIRVPVIPRINDSEKELTAIADFISSLPCVERIDLLPFHQIGKSKYAALNQDYLLAETAQMHENELTHKKELFKQRGLSPAASF